MSDVTRIKRSLLPDEKISAGIALLKKGCRSSAWVCREFLGLDGGTNKEDVIAAVHVMLHSVPTDVGTTREERCVAAITAGAVLLRGQ